jgi:hypothetical protein
MKLTEELVKNILNSMFWNYDFQYEYEIYDDYSFDFFIKTNEFTEDENNIIPLYLEWKDEYIIIKILLQSESYETIGKYYIKDDSKYNIYIKGDFERNDNFWEMMFVRLLK